MNNNNFANSLRQLFSIKPDLRQNFLESKYFSKNKDLIKILTELVNDDYTIDTIVIDFIRENKWEEFNNHVMTHSGINNFFLLLKQLLLYKYFLPEEERITRKQFETAMGIQQVCWMVDKENCKQMQRYSVESAKFFYWNDIPPNKENENEKDFILNQIYNKINGKLNDDVKKKNGAIQNASAIKKTLEALLSGTVWYNVVFKNEKNEQVKIDAWSGFGSNKVFQSYFPLPETLNFSSISCIYTPKLVFGSLSDSSLLKFIILNSQRPYAAHIPNGSSNLCIIHDIKHCIVANWIHDFHHSASGVCSQGFLTMNDKCKFERGTINQNNVVRHLMDTNSDLNKCLARTQDALDAYNKKKHAAVDSTVLWIRSANDTGMIWHSLPLQVFQGGAKKYSTKRKQIKRKVIKVRKTRKIYKK